jgi:PAS domain-containing protein
MPEVDATSKLWKLLWDKDPNGLLVLDADLRVRLVNPAFCRMFKVQPGALLGSLAADLLEDVSDFRLALAQGSELKALERAYPRHDLYARKVIFAIPEERIVAGIFVDLSVEWRHSQEFSRLKREAIQEVRQVVDKQMQVAQEIAGLLGETTAETKVSLLRLLEMLQREEKPLGGGNEG